MLPQHHQQNPPPPPPSSHLQDGYFAPSHPSSSTRVATMASSRQEYVHKEMESTFHLVDPCQGHPRNPRSETRSDYLSSEPWYGRMHLENTVPPKNQPADMREPKDYEIRSTRFQSQSSQDSGSRRPSKRKRKEHDDLPPPSPSSSFINAPPSERLTLTVPIRIPPLRSSTDSSSTAFSSSSSSINNDEPPPALLILDADLWAQFHEQHNEMIITKSGRCLFPCLRFKILGLDPNSYYSMRLDFEMLTPNRFRFYNGAWKPVEPLRKVDDSYSTASHDSTDSNDYSTATTSGHLRESYIHPDRFQLGSHWMANPISFTKVKMTNNVESPSRVAKRAAFNQRTDSTASATNGSRNGDLCGAPTSILSSVHDINTNMFHMTSFHKYCPRIYLTQRAKGSNEIINSIVYRFDRTEFMAVTHYQNYKVKDLKKSYNPHAKGFRGTIGKVLPPVKFPAAAKQHYREELDKHPLLTKLARPRKRTRSSWRSDEGDSDEGMDGDYDPDSEEADMNESVVMDSVGAMMGGSRSGMQAATVGASMTRVLEENISPNCRLDKDNDTLVTISLGKDGQGDAKISERTTQHYFDQNASLNGNAAVQIPEFYSRATTSAASCMGEQSLPLVQNSSGDSFMRSRHFNGINQHQYQNHRQQQSQQQSLLLPGESNKEIGDEQQRNPPLQSLFFNRAPTVRMDRVPTHLSDTTRDTLSMVSSPLHMSSMPNNTVVDDDDDNAANLLQLKQSIPSITLGPLENELMSDQNSSRVLSTELECSNLVAADATTLALNTTPAPPPLSWYQQFLWDRNSANLSQNPAPTATSTASTVVPDDVDGSGIPLTLQQLAAMDSAAVDLVPSSTLNPHGVSSMQFPTGQIAYDDGCGNGVAPTMSIFGSGTSTPSLAIATSSAHSGPSSVTSGRSRAGPSIYGDPYGYGLGGSGNHTGSSSNSGGGFNPDPRTLKTTILESKTFMPPSSVISILPVPGAAVAVEDTQQTKIDCLFHENLRLKAFIRERYGIEAESEANAVVAMEYYQ